MSNYSLIAQSPLHDLETKIGGVTLLELSNLALVSFAIPNEARNRVATSFANQYQIDLPAVGRSIVSSIAQMSLLGMQSDQLFALFEYDGDRAVEYLRDTTSDAAYLCDQSDSWVMLRMSGETCTEALERMCPIDLHTDIFFRGSVARTAMEHMAVIILREGDNQFLLLSPRSSAESFLHAVTTSIKNTSE